MNKNKRAYLELKVLSYRKMINQKQNELKEIELLKLETEKILNKK